MELPPSLFSQLKIWMTDETVAFALLGSYARGDAGPFSDVDVVRFVNDDSYAAEGQNGTFLLDDTLVVCSTATPSQVESWFTEPGQAVNVMAGLRDGRPLWDPDGIFAHIQRRAYAFQWTQMLQTKANALVGQEMVGWVEEVHKGLEGLRRNDSGRLLNARYGLSWGLAWVMRVSRGVLSNSDNAFFEDVIHAVGVESRWSQLLRRAFGVESTPPSLRAEVTAGLLLYCETFALLEAVLPRQAHPLIAATVQRIRAELSQDILL